MVCFFARSEPLFFLLLFSLIDHTYGYREVKLQRVELINNDKLKQKYLKSETTSKEDMYETLVFHGTPKDSNIESISKHNFDISKLGITTGNDG